MKSADQTLSDRRGTYSGTRSRLEGQVLIHALELRQLSFQLLGSAQILGVHPSVLRLLLVVRRSADPVLAANLLHGMPTSACFRIEIIRVSVKRDFFIRAS